MIMKTRLKFKGTRFLISLVGWHYATWIGIFNKSPHWLATRITM